MREAGNEGAANTIAAQLTPLIERVMDGYGLAGLEIGVVKDGEVLLARGFGVRSVESGAPVTERSLFHMASVSKPFVATAIVQLWEEAMLELEAPVVTYLPYFALAGGDYGRITIRQLLSHTAGVPDTDSYSWHAPEYDDGALERYVRSIAGEKMVDAPGARYAYSNIGYEVLGDVIAKVAGKPFEVYVKRHILEPLGMGDSTFLRREVDPALATTPHVGAPLAVLPGAYPYNRAHAPSSTLHSSAADMCRWMLANLAHGTLDGRCFVSETGHAALWHPEVVTGEQGWDEVRCLGWGRGTYRGHPVVHHSGSDPGYFADLVLLPELQAGVVVMANAYCATAWGITDAALDLLLGLAPALPRKPITVPLGQALQAGGVEAAVAEYRGLQEAAVGEYDFGEKCLLAAVWGAIELHRPEAVMPLLNVWAALFPASAEAQEWLGRAYWASGERVRAEASWRKALELEPENEVVRGLLER
jgi:CubicO group peptidase (beta-lactamase class C family)